MNSPFALEQAKAFAARPDVAGSRATRRRSSGCTGWPTARKPDAEEVELGLAFVRGGAKGGGLTLGAVRAGAAAGQRVRVRGLTGGTSHGGDTEGQADSGPRAVCRQPGEVLAQRICCLTTGSGSPGASTASRIVAHHDDLDRGRCEASLEAGLTTEEVVFDRIPMGGGRGDHAMTMRFPYRQVTMRPDPIVSLGGRPTRPRTILGVTVCQCDDLSRTLDALLDTGADDTVFPEHLAQRLGIDLSTAETGVAQGVGGQLVTVRYAPVRLRDRRSSMNNASGRRWSAFAPSAKMPCPCSASLAFCNTSPPPSTATVRRSS